MQNVNPLLFLADLETLNRLYDHYERVINIPLVASTGGESGEPVIIWARAEATSPRNLVSRSVLRDLQREDEAREDEDGLFVELDIVVGTGRKRKVYPVQRFDVVEDVANEGAVKVLVGGEFLKKVGALSVDEQGFGAVPDGLRVLVEKDVGSAFE
jgi:hypothetical protein